MTTPSRLLADVHLSEQHPARTALFLQVLGNQAAASTAVYLLGDIFDIWLGDDDTRPLAVSVATGLRALTTRGVPVYWLAGNRDFLLGPQFGAQTGVQLLPDPVCLDLHGTPTWLSHGDQFCVDDPAYQAFRHKVRNPAWQQEFLAKPLAERQKIAQGYRADSQYEQTLKPEAILDVNRTAIDALWTQSPARRLIHGHTHRPALHVTTLADASMATRYVLPAWEATQGYALAVDTQRVWLETYTA